MATNPPDEKEVFLWPQRTEAQPCLERTQLTGWLQMLLCFLVMRLSGNMPSVTCWKYTFWCSRESCLWDVSHLGYSTIKLFDRRWQGKLLSAVYCWRHLQRSCRHYREDTKKPSELQELGAGESASTAELGTGKVTDAAGASHQRSQQELPSKPTSTQKPHLFSVTSFQRPLLVKPDITLAAKGTTT